MSGGPDPLCVRARTVELDAADALAEPPDGLSSGRRLAEWGAGPGTVRWPDQIGGGRLGLRVAEPRSTTERDQGETDGNNQETIESRRRCRAGGRRRGAVARADRPLPGVPAGLGASRRRTAGHTGGRRAWKQEQTNRGWWGADDERGTLNLITPEKRRQAAALVREGHLRPARARRRDRGDGRLVPSLDRRPLCAVATGVGSVRRDSWRSEQPPPTPTTSHHPTSGTWSAILGLGRWSEALA